ncbi:hypothetical protein ACEWY4_002908 [Coilia grayii]|uniref:Bcl-2-like protein 12 n=1 Tax=Coilia grayii TaxID=363190 RepID=A0ABD1KPS1_9TELE
MSDGGARPSSPSPSVSLLEAKAETRLVLKSLLRKTLAVAPEDRPGRVGGTYHDPNKFSAAARSPKKTDNGWDSLDEAISTAEEKKHSIKNLIKRRLRPRSISRPDTPKNKAGTLERDRKPDKLENGQPTSFPEILQNKLVPEDAGSSSSFSEEEGEEGKKKKKKSKRKIHLPSIFRTKSKSKATDPQRPSTLVIPAKPPPKDPQLSPSHPPEFYNEVAGTLERFAKKSMKKPKPVPPPLIPPPQSEPAATGVQDKNTVVQQLVQILCREGDILNEKITANPFLRSSLDRLSYPSFAKLLDTYASQTEATPAPLPSSPTLRKVAITMEASCRVLTATGARQRMKGYAERYMENFAPWVRSHGGWENIVEDIPEYD